MVERTFSKGFLKLFLLLRTSFLSLYIITNDFTTAICDFLRGILAKRILKNFRGKSNFSKTWSYRTATLL